jgi:hypothetical protein
MDTLKKLETSHTLWSVIDDEAILEPYSGRYSSHIKNAILFEISEDDEDGTYPRVCDYIRLTNAIESEGTSAYLNRCAKRKKLSFEFMGVTITRTAEYEDNAVIEFKTPIDVVFGRVGEEPIIRKVKKMTGEFTHDWFWRNNGRQDKVANGFEIWFNIKECLE